MKASRGRRSKGIPHVALIIETSTAYGRAIIRGATRYIREAGPWTVYIEQRSLQDSAPPWLEGWDGDGIISRASTPRSARAVLGTGIPTVDLNDQVRAAIARLAAEHLLERGFHHFAYFGFPVFEWSVRRHDAFAKCVRAAGCEFHENVSTPRVSWGHQQSSWEGEVEGAARWIKGLPKPLGVMTGNDPRGIQLLDACRRAGVAVPEEVAVVGVDNDELVCDLAYPPLSSVIPDAARIGYEAAELLDRLMKGETAPAAMQTVPPQGLAIRQSSDVTAIADPRLADALRFIRLHACDGIGVDDVLEHVAVSRSVLQRLFRRHCDRTILDTITGVRIARVKQLLTETDLPLADIARRAGFSYMEYLSNTFRRQTGWTLSAFRREFVRPRP
jgi:LacI family transcriptional regulator